MSVIDIPDLSPHAHDGGTALNHAPGINTIHRVAVSAPGRPTATHKRRSGLPLECRKLLDKLQDFEGASPPARKKEPRALTSRGLGVSKPAMGGKRSFAATHRGDRVAPIPELPVLVWGRGGSTPFRTF